MKPIYIVLIVILVIVILYFILKPSTAAANTPKTLPPPSNTGTFNLGQLLTSLFGHSSGNVTNGNGVLVSSTGSTADGAGCELYNSDMTPAQGVYSKGVCEPVGVLY